MGAAEPWVLAGKTAQGAALGQLEEGWGQGVKESLKAGSQGPRPSWRREGSPHKGEERRQAIGIC